MALYPGGLRRLREALAVNAEDPDDNANADGSDETLQARLITAALSLALTR